MMASKLKVVGLAIAGSVSAVLLAWNAVKWYKRLWYEKECKKIRDARDSKITTLRRKLLSMQLDEERIQYITSLPLSKLRDKLKSGELTALETLHAYQWCALEAHEQTNCLTNVFEDADAVAKQLDAKVNKDGLLHGIPVTIKDNLPTKGHVNTRGCVVFRNDIPEEDALIVKVLREHGAVPFVKTNIPQLMMGVESSNAIYGATCNPHDHSRTPGGSSGGEGAVISYGASILGMGSDIGGSIRIPSAHCGIYGLKTTSERLSKVGFTPYGQTIVRSCWGPMARDVDSLVLAMEALLTPPMFNNDQTIPPMPFDMDQYSSKCKLTIGYYVDDGLHCPTPAVRRSVEEAKNALRSRGHKLVPWEIPRQQFGHEAVIRSISGDKGCMFKQMVQHDKIHESINYMKGAFMSDFPRSIIVKLLKLQGEHVAAMGMEAARGVPTVLDLFNWTTRVKLYIYEFQKSWSESGLDAVICPVAAQPALKLSSSAKHDAGTYYTSLYNLLDYAAGVVPVTKVTRDDIDRLADYPKDTRLQRYLVEDLQDSEGIPVAVQCVTPSWREELCLRVMKELDDGLKFIGTNE